MAFFEDLSKKTKNMTEIARCNSAIAEDERNCNNTLLLIGQKYVEQYAKDYDNAPEAFRPLLHALQQAQMRIAENKRRIEDLKGLVRCPSCGAAMEPDGAFCTNCGAQMPRVQPQATGVPAFCTHCGAKLQAGSKFCTSCGTPVPMTMPQTSGGPASDSPSPSLSKSPSPSFSSSIATSMQTASHLSVSTEPVTSVPADPSPCDDSAMPMTSDLSSGVSLSTPASDSPASAAEMAGNTAAPAGSTARSAVVPEQMSDIGVPPASSTTALGNDMEKDANGQGQTPTDASINAQSGTPTGAPTNMQSGTSTGAPTGAVETSVNPATEATDRVSVLRSCPNCGKPAPDGTLFCTKCGTRLES